LITWGNVLALATGITLLYAGIHMAIDTQKVIEGLEISLEHDGASRTITMKGHKGDL
jgi:hypothetical protein